MDNNLFTNNDTIEEIILHEDIITICSFSFANCTNLKRVYTVKENSYNNIKTKLDISTEMITFTSFINCNNLTDIYLPRNINRFFYRNFRKNTDKINFLLHNNFKGFMNKPTEGLFNFILEDNPSESVFRLLSLHDELINDLDKSLYEKYKDQIEFFKFY